MEMAIYAPYGEIVLRIVWIHALINCTMGNFVASQPDRLTCASNKVFRIWELATQMGISYALKDSTNSQSVIETHSPTSWLSLTLMSAPFFTRTCTVPTWPLSAAQCKGVILLGEAHFFMVTMNVQVAKYTWSFGMRWNSCVLNEYMH